LLADRPEFRPGGGEEEVAEVRHGHGDSIHFAQSAVFGVVVHEGSV
jgi:hypothetical protein